MLARIQSLKKSEMTLIIPMLKLEKKNKMPGPAFDRWYGGFHRALLNFLFQVFKTGIFLD
jgi:hypothetical protein